VDSKEFIGGRFAVAISLSLSSLMPFTVGAIITVFRGKPVWRSGGRQLFLGVAAAGVTFAWAACSALRSVKRDETGEGNRPEAQAERSPDVTPLRSERMSRLAEPVVASVTRLPSRGGGAPEAHSMRGMPSPTTAGAAPYSGCLRAASRLSWRPPNTR
jgi:hypothetical protein